MPNIGQLIKNYRIRNKTSQMELELAIGAASGSVSRVELGKVNPSKETLSKIISYLDLNLVEACQLYELNLQYFNDLLKASQRIHGCHTYEQLIQTTVDVATEILSLSGGAIYEYREGEIFFKSLANHPVSIRALKLTPVPLTQFVFSVKKHPENSLVRAVVSRQLIKSHRLSEVISPPVPKMIANTIQKLTKIKVVISIPHIYEDVIVGVSVFGKLDELSPAEEMILSTLAEQMSEQMAMFERN